VQLQHDDLGEVVVRDHRGMHGALKFFQDRLNYNTSQSSGRKYLRETYPKFIPHKPDEDKAQ
jgi:hypothetical protein